MKHTPAPWVPVWGESVIVSPEEDSGHDDEENVREYGGPLVAGSVHQRNMALIAAAPELLAACQLALSEDTGLAAAPALRAAIRLADAIPFDEEP